MIFTNDAPSIELSVTELLAALRHEMEEDSLEPIYEIEVPAALLLDDVCNALELPPHARLWVLGDEGMAFVESVKETPIQLVGNRNGRPLVVSGQPSVG